jgi:hypothetical protein
MTGAARVGSGRDGDDPPGAASQPTPFSPLWNLPMKSFFASVFLVGGLVSGAPAAEPAASGPSSSDKALIDYLVRQDQLHTEEIARLKAELARPKTRQEAFAACMQAAKGQSAMAAESIGEHCDRLLK